MYWSGEDPYAAERSEALIIRGLLSEDDIASCHSASATRAPPANTNPNLYSDELRHVKHDIAYDEHHVALYLHQP